MNDRYYHALETGEQVRETDTVLITDGETGAVVAVARLMTDAEQADLERRRTEKEGS